MTPEFRVWDKVNKVYDVPTQIDIDDSGHISCVDTYHGSLVDSDLALEQYTGLKDVKGNKIFEGDIVRVCYVGDFDGENPHNQFVTSVEFNAPMFDLNRHHIPQEWALYSSLSALFDLFEDDDYEIEVIGNIHENPELLEVDE